MKYSVIQKSTNKAKGVVTQVALETYRKLVSNTLKDDDPKVKDVIKAIKSKQAVSPLVLYLDTSGRVVKTPKFYAKSKYVLAAAIKLGIKHAQVLVFVVDSTGKLLPPLVKLPSGFELQAEGTKWKEFKWYRSTLKKKMVFSDLSGDKLHIDPKTSFGLLRSRNKVHLLDADDIAETFYIDGKIADKLVANSEELKSLYGKPKVKVVVEHKQTKIEPAIPKPEEIEPAPANEPEKKHIIDVGEENDPYDDDDPTTDLFGYHVDGFGFDSNSSSSTKTKVEIQL
jgi:hypothetical protein